MRLMDKVALVTGGSRGIGKAILLEFAKQGAKVAFTYLNNEDLAKSLEQQIIEAGGMAAAFKVDTSNFEDCRAMVKAVDQKFGNIDILVNNAGITKDAPLLKMSPDDWNGVIQTNLNGIYNITRNCIFNMLKNKSGRIINLSSISGIHGLPGQTNYSASKAGIIGFTHSLAKEVAKYGITVNVVAPGGVNTDMLTALSEKAKQELLSFVPIGRFCEPEEVTNVVLYLASESPLYLTGSTIILDGGAGG